MNLSIVDLRTSSPSVTEIFFFYRLKYSIISDSSPRVDFLFSYVFSYIDFRVFAVGVDQMDSSSCLIKGTVCVLNSV